MQDKTRRQKLQQKVHHLVSALIAVRGELVSFTKKEHLNSIRYVRENALADTLRDDDYAKRVKNIIGDALHTYGVREVTRMSHITVGVVRCAPHTVFLFGDNLRRTGKGGQAVIRGEPNAIGIATKKAPRMDKAAFFTDHEYEENCRIIDLDFERIPFGVHVVLPKRGLGTGRAKLKEKAPKTWRYLQMKIAELEEIC